MMQLAGLELKPEMIGLNFKLELGGVGGLRVTGLRLPLELAKATQKG